MRLFLHYSTLFRRIPHGCVNIACEDGHFSERSVYADAALHRCGRVIGADRAEMCGKCAPEGRNARKLPQFARKKRGSEVICIFMHREIAANPNITNTCIYYMDGNATKRQ